MQKKFSSPTQAGKIVTSFLDGYRLKRWVSALALPARREPAVRHKAEPMAEDEAALDAEIAALRADSARIRAQLKH